MCWFVWVTARHTRLFGGGEAVIQEQFFTRIGSSLQLTLVRWISHWGEIPAAPKALGSATFAILLVFLAIRRNQDHDEFAFAAFGLGAVLLLAYALTLFASLIPMGE
jgi:hypothetical protein